MKIKELLATFGFIFFPTLTWLIIMIWSMPTISFLSLALVIMVSQRATGVWESQQISMLLLLPIIGLVISQAAGVVYISAGLVFATGLLFLITDVMVFRWIVKTFDRERIVTKMAG